MLLSDDLYFIIYSNEVCEIGLRRIHSVSEHITYKCVYLDSFRLHREYERRFWKMGLVHVSRFILWMFHLFYSSIAVYFNYIVWFSSSNCFLKKVKERRDVVLISQLYAAKCSFWSCSPVNPVTNVVPLSLVLLVSLIKEAWEDWVSFSF